MNKRRRKKKVKKFLASISKKIYEISNEVLMNQMLYGIAGVEIMKDHIRILSYEECCNLDQNNLDKNIILMV